MNILIASNYLELTDAIEAELAQSGIKAELTPIETIDDLVSALVTDRYHYIIAEYSLNGSDIWQLAKLVNSTQLAAHAIPIYLIKDSCEMEIPMLLAKAHDFKVVACQHLGDTLKEDHSHNLATGYRRGRRPTEKPTLLIVEDDVDAAILIEYNLRNEFACDVAQTGEMGLVLWEQKRHELVLLDYMLPGIKGDVVLEKMMAIDPYQPVIVMTAYDHQERNKDMILNGASEYLCKPFEITLLKKQCAAILNRAKLIYQAHTADTQTETLGNLFWVLDHALTHHDFDKAKRLVGTIKRIFPIHPSDDEQINLLKLEF